MANEITEINGVPIRLVDNGDGTHSIATSITGSLAKNEIVASNQIIPAGTTYTSPYFPLSTYTKVSLFATMNVAAVTTGYTPYIDHATGIAIYNSTDSGVASLSQYIALTVKDIRGLQTRFRIQNADTVDRTMSSMSYYAK